MEYAIEILNNKKIQLENARKVYELSSTKNSLNLLDSVDDNIDNLEKAVKWLETEMSKQQALNIANVTECYDLPDDFESKIAKMIKLDIEFTRFGLNAEKYEEREELNYWYGQNDWKY